MNKKYQKLIFYFTIALAVVAFIGLAMLLLSSKDFADAGFDTIVLFTAIVSIGIALYSQMALDREARRVEKLMRDLSDVDKTLESDMAIDKNVRNKLDHIIALEEEIYKKTGGRKDPKNVTKEYRADHPEKPAKRA